MCVFCLCYWRPTAAVQQKIAQCCLEQQLERRGLSNGLQFCYVSDGVLPIDSTTIGGHQTCAAVCLH
jgi:hypothetical protein